MFTFTNSILSVSASSPSSRTVTAWQGEHQGAQKSTATGRPAWRTSSSKLASVISRTDSRLQAAAQRLDPQQRHLPDRLGDDRLAHLGVPELAVGEGDRHLDHAEAGAHHAIGRLDLERVAPGADRVE